MEQVRFHGGHFGKELKMAHKMDPLLSRLSSPYLSLLFPIDHWILLQGQRLYVRIKDPRAFGVVIMKYGTVIHHKSFPASNVKKTATFDLSSGKHTVIVKFSTGDQMWRTLQV